MYLKEFSTTVLRAVFAVFLTALVFVSGCGNSPTAVDDPEVPAETKTENRGEEIMAEYLKRNSSPYRKSRVRLTVENDDGKKEVYVLETARKQIDDETRTLTHIVEPAEDENIATLTIENKGKETVNVNYISSRDQFRESGTNKMFFGGLTSQELLGEWDKYKTKLIEEKEVGGQKVFELESTLKPKASSVISRIVSVFSADDYLPRELHLYNSDGKEIRTFQITETREIAARKFVAKTLITNHIYNSKITIEVLEMTFPEGLPNEIFERDHLKVLAAKSS
ncbi:MAG: outer membrane lipoprotein-sorting protein [Pyrinomonadaceae bacterium]